MCVCPLCVQTYNRVQFAGRMFRTASSQKTIKADDSHIRIDYKAPGPRGQVLPAFAQIKRMFVHEAYPGGPSRVVVEGEWYEPVGTCVVARTKLVRKNPSYCFNTSSKFVFLDDCYSVPVALWPHDPLKTLPAEDPLRDCFDVIDCNQEEILQ
jgi:hypothetical protein